MRRSIAVLVAFAALGATPIDPAAAAPGASFAAHVKYVSVLGDPASIDIPVRYRCFPSDEGSLAAAVVQWQYNGVGTAVPDPTNSVPVAIYTNTATPFTPYTPYAGTCDGKNHKASITIPRIPGPSFIAGEALLTILLSADAGSIRREIVVDVR